MRGVALAFLLLVLPATAGAQEGPIVDPPVPPHYFAVLVADLERAVGWYSETFGLVVRSSADAEDGSWSIRNLSGPGLSVELIRTDRSAPADRPLGLFKVGFSVPSVDAVAARLAAAGAEPPRVVQLDGLRILQLSDPEGNRIQLHSRSPSVCLAPDAMVGLDHVVVAVRDLEAAASRISDAGFSVKDGRAHANRLRNAHIKFVDGTSVELMTLGGDPGDDVASAYASFLEAGEGGAYLALRGDRARVLDAALGAGITVTEAGGNAFRYAIFPDLPHVFVLEYGIPVVDGPGHLNHENGARGIARAVVDGGELLANLLRVLGGTECGVDPDDDSVHLFGLRNGVVGLRRPRAGERPEVRDILLTGNAAGELDLAGVRLRLQPEPH